MNRNSALILLKTELTMPVGLALVYPFLNATASGGVLREIEMLGPIGGVALTAAFFAFIILYCRAQQRALSQAAALANMPANSNLGRQQVKC